MGTLADEYDDIIDVSLDKRRFTNEKYSFFMNERCLDG
jgi:hypothetical protein